jgi:hypothetical protein
MTGTTRALIEKLLALAADANATKSERAAAQAKAMELITEMLAGRPVPC